MMNKLLSLIACLALCMLPSPASSQPYSFSVSGTVEVVTIQSPGLVGNLLGDSPNREMTIYLPPGYQDSPGNYYPVIYFLHGYNCNNTTFFGNWPKAGDLEIILNGLIKNGDLPPVILVSPNFKNNYGGGFYTNSYVTGQWEDFIVKDVVRYMDDNYRTIASRESRGLAGHSMGGYGTLKQAMKHPSVFGSAYALSPWGCMLEGIILDSYINDVIEARNSNDFNSMSFNARVVIAAAAAYAPDSAVMPFMGQIPATGTGERIDSIWDRWEEHDLYTMQLTHRDSLLKLSAFRFDCGTEDEFDFFPYCKGLADTLDKYGIPGVFESFDGGHASRLAERIETRMFPFFRSYLETWVPGITLLSEAYLTPADTLKLAMDRSGWVSIVPSPTPAVPDSILDRQLFSTRLDSGSTLKVPLGEFGYGKYTVYGLSADSAYVTSPLLIGVDNKTGIPVINALQDTVEQGDTLFVECDKNGTVYLVLPGTTPDNLYQTNRIKATATISAGSIIGIPTADIYPKSYILLAEDQFGFFSEPDTVHINAAPTFVRELSETCRLYPNPSFDLLYIDTGQPGTWSVDVHSANGRTMTNNVFHGSTFKLDLSSFQSGVYFITIRSKELVTTKKIIKM